METRDHNKNGCVINNKFNLKMKKVILIFALAVLLAGCYKNEWQKTNCPGKGIYNYLLISEDNYFAATNEGMYLSTNFGEKWDTICNGLYTAIKFKNKIEGSKNEDSLRVPYKNRILVSYKKKIITGTDHGIFVFDNLKKAWDKIVFDTTYRDTPQNVFSLLPDKENLLVGTDRGIYILCKNDSVWTIKENKLENFYVNNMIRIKEHLFACTLGGIFKSTDDGENWVLKNSGIVLNDNLRSLFVHSISYKGNTIYIGTDAGIYKSIDDGETWTHFSNGDMGNFHVFSLNCINNVMLAGTEGSGVFKLENDSIWKDINYNITGKVINSIEADNSNIFICTFDLMKIPIVALKENKLHE